MHHSFNHYMIHYVPIVGSILLGIALLFFLVREILTKEGEKNDSETEKKEVEDKREL